MTQETPRTDDCIVSERLAMDYLVQIARCAAARPVLRLTGVCLLTLSFAMASQAHSTNRPADDLVEVDLQLILAVDVSPSMSRGEQRVQRDGYVGCLPPRGHREGNQVGRAGQDRGALSGVGRSKSANRHCAVDNCRKPRRRSDFGRQARGAVVD